MLSKITLFALANTLLASATTVAPTITNNPRDVVLRADFPSGNSQSVVGVIQFYSLNGTTKVHVDITGLPKNSGIFSYHIHEKPLHQPGARCEETGDHFNPFNSQGDCDSLNNDSLCEIGDLSGKHGLINTTCFETFYYDPYISLDPSNAQYIGNKAINIHLVDKNNERLACANIKPSKEPEDLLLLNAETERQEVKKYEDLSGVKIEQFDYYTDEDLVDYSFAASSIEIDDEPSKTVEEAEEEAIDNDGESEQEHEQQGAVPEDDSESNAVEEDSDVTDESLDFGKDDDLEELVKKDVSGNHTVPGNYSFNVTGSSGDDDKENSGITLSHQSIFVCICAMFVALLI